MSQNAYQQGLDKNAANYVPPLSPLSFIRRTAMVYPTRTSVVHACSSTLEPDLRAALPPPRDALVAHRRERRAIRSRMLPNVPSMFATSGVPMTGAVLNTLNPARRRCHRLHARPWRGQVLITDPEFRRRGPPPGRCRRQAPGGRRPRPRVSGHRAHRHRSLPRTSSPAATP